MQFQMAKVGEAIWPEVAGVATYGAAEIAGAYGDSRLSSTVPWIQTGITVVTLVGSAYLIGTGKVVGFAKGLLYGSGVGLILNLVTLLWQKATGQSTGLRGGDVAALIPKALTSRGGGLQFKLEAGKTLSLGGGGSSGQGQTFQPAVVGVATRGML